MKIQLNHCPICGDRFIADKGKPLPNHRQYRVILSGGNETDLAVCRKHNLSEKDFIKLTRLNLDYISNQLKKDDVLKEVYKNMKYIGRKDKIVHF